MPALPAPRLCESTCDEPAFGPGRADAVGGSRRVTLGRGLAFVLLLTASRLGSVYAPTPSRGTDWVEGTAAPGAPR